MRLGEWQQVKIAEKAENGWLVDCEGEIIFLSKEDATVKSAELGEQLQVFGYLLNGGERAITMQQPLIEIGQFKALEVKEVNRIGAFLDWGLKKDLLLPFGEQHRRVEVGHKVVVRMYLDEKTQRLSATTKLGRFMPKMPRVFLRGEDIEILIVRKTPLGFAVIAEDQRWGMIYDNQIYQQLEIGERLRAFVTELRTDGRLDIALQEIGQKHANNLSQSILSMLEASGGMLPFSDSTPPEIINREFNTSKKAFKRAIGQLYRKGQIELGEGSIFLKKED